MTHYSMHGDYATGRDFLPKHLINFGAMVLSQEDIKYSSLTYGVHGIRRWNINGWVEIMHAHGITPEKPCYKW